jgi:hypothetical protein
LLPFVPLRGAGADSSSRQGAFAFGAIELNDSSLACLRLGHYISRNTIIQLSGM